MEDAITTVEVDDSPMNEKSHDNNDMHETKLAEINDAASNEVE